MALATVPKYRKLAIKKCYYCDRLQGCKLFAVTSWTILAVNSIVNTETLKITNPPFKLRRWNDVYQTRNQFSFDEKNDTNEWLFKDYMKKFRPINVWERLYKKKKAQGLNISLENSIDDMFNGIDETDELLKIKLDDNFGSGRRKWTPPGKLDYSIRENDLFSLRRRFFEMILHSMYWTRNKMIVMQTFRKKYRNSKLYKMGFMMSKNDVACKMFHRFAYRAFTTCSATWYTTMYRYYPLEMLHAEERMLYKWFDISLLTDLIVKNDLSCKEMLEEVNVDREEAWEFYD
ncbi:hypothetical protein evm_014356 [Chilo suppressalis]|nr:hypothetical protein evm_014356 [Chilo suppressalis]